MRQRLISAAVLVPVVVIVFLVGEPLLSFGILILGALAALETADLVSRAGLPASKGLAVAGTVATVVVMSLAFVPTTTSLWGPIAVGFVALVLIVAAIFALRATEPLIGFRNWVGTTIAILYPSLIVFVLNVMLVAPAVHGDAPLARVLDTGRVWLLVLVLTVWSLDTFAYLAGRTYPRGRMAPHISPNKTWSGAAGGTLAAVIVCTVLVWATGQHPLGGAGLGLLIAVAAQAGDLTESMLKRAAGVKDSGTLIPGHGGILDRVDSFLFAAPAMFLALTATQLLAVTRPA
jgi:phosphatidate cytidylyltransferase